MSAAPRRSLLVTLFGVVGTLWFALHAVEYLYFRYPALDGWVALPDPLGGAWVFAGMPDWAEITLTATIWIGLLGAVLLLVGERASVLILAVTMLLALVPVAWGGLAMVQSTGRAGSLEFFLFTAGLAALTIGLWLLARTAKRANWF